MPQKTNIAYTEALLFARMEFKSVVGETQCRQELKTFQSGSTLNPEYAHRKQLNHTQMPLQS